LSGEVGVVLYYKKNADLLYDETFDEANELIDDWNDLNK
jgi:hypothetical protein